jgi:hypothetical protein
MASMGMEMGCVEMHSSDTKVASLKLPSIKLPLANEHLEIFRLATPQHQRLTDFLIHAPTFF